MSEEYPLKRVSYVQVQIPDLENIIINFSVRSYKLVEDLPVDGPVYLEKSYTHTMKVGDIGDACMNFAEYLISMVQED